MRRLALGAFILAFAACALAPEHAQAKRIFVPRQHKRLQAAIDAASSGDTIWVAAGTYYGPFVIKKPLVLFGDGGSGKTILDGRDSVRVLHIEGVVRGAIYGFRIQNGKAPGGGGLYCLRDSLFIVGSCEIRSNWEAGLAAWKCRLLQLVDSEISGNKGSGVTASDSKLRIYKVTFRDNHGPSGGGISLVSSEALMQGCFFEANRADDGTGGGILAESSSLVRLMNCTFRENSAAAGGGAVAARDSSDLKIHNGFFAANHSSTGGAVLTDVSSLEILSSIFSKNRATAAGAAVQILGRRTAGVNPFLGSNTFYRNGVEDEGSAVFASEVSPEIVRNIFVIDSTLKNVAVLAVKGVPRYECNLIHPLDGRRPTASANTIIGDPVFCDAEKGDFHVRDLSPALLTPCGKLGAMGKGCTSFRPLPSQ